MTTYRGVFPPGFDKILVGPVDEGGALRVEDENGVRWIAPEPPGASND